jgi:TrmH RNA methyltransferase
MSSETESTVYGVNAALAVAALRPDAILRVFHVPAVRLRVAPLLKAAAAHRRPYREVPDSELERIAKTVHHEGVVVVCRPLPLLDEARLFGTPLTAPLYVALDEVGNPHNLGAILRSAAFFGAGAMLFPREGRSAHVSAAATRIAQGGAERVPCYAVTDLATTLRRLSQGGVQVVGADTRGGVALARFVWRRPTCVVLGNEGEGLSKTVRAACSGLVSIPGDGGVESLNVSVAAGILLAAAHDA